jgi:chemotaxis protein MotA
VDWASVAGLVLAVAGILVGHSLDGGRFASLVQPAAFAIVVVGTFGAVLLQSERRTFTRGLAMLRWVFVPPRGERQKLSREIALWSLSARRDGLLSLEQYMTKADPFVEKGLRLVVDGIAPDKLRSLLEHEINGYEFAQRQAARMGIGSRLCADDRHPGRRAGPDPRDGKPVRSGAPGFRHRGRFCFDRVRRGSRQPVLLPGRQQA